MELYQHQKRLLDLNPIRHLLAFETGTGKTLTATSLSNKNATSVLVVVPKGLKTQWTEHLEEHSTIPYQLFSKEEFKKHVKTIPRHDCVIIDEAHYFSGMKSQMSKALEWYLRTHDVTFRYFLTATPYLSTPWNIYRLATLLGYSINYMNFDRMFFYRVQMGQRMIPQVKDTAQAKEALNEIVNKIGTTVKLEDCVDLPDQIYRTEHFTLTPKQKKAIASLDDTNHIVRWTKIHQICGGTLKEDLEMETEALNLPCEKLDRLMDLAMENPRMIVVGRYRAEVDMLKEELSKKHKKVLLINGDTPAEHRSDILKQLQQADEYILLVTASISEGWELPDCPLMVFYSLDFSLKNRVQMEGRIRRINALKKNLYLTLIVKETIDEDVFSSLEKKEDFHLSLYKK